MTDVSAVDRKSPQKLYCQLLEILKDPIERGEWKVGMQIPTEEQICGRYGVSKTTVRSAIEELVALGYLKKLQGIGTFVRRLIPDYLQLRPGESCSHLVRVLLLGGMPLALESLFVPSGLCVGDLGERGTAVPLTACVEGLCALKIQRLREKTDLRCAGEQEAVLLRIPPLAPALRIRQFFYRTGDQPVGFASTMRRIDRFGRILEFERL